MEAGTYRAKIVDAGLVDGKKGPQVMVSFDAGVAGRITWFSGFGTDRAMAYTVNQLTNAGFTSDLIEEVGEIVGREVEIVVKDEEYNGEIQQRVAFINGARAKLDADRAASFSAEIRSRIAAARAAKPARGGGGGQIPTGVSRAAAIADDDTPF